MPTVHVRINDAATGVPTPVRLRVTGPGGEYLPPLGRPAEFPAGRGEGVGIDLHLGQECWTTIDGTCEIPLPAGRPVRVRATKGPEYRPLDATLAVVPGRLTARFEIGRIHDTRAAGYHPGDGRAHFLTPAAALLEAQAEDLAVVQLLAAAHRLPSQDGHSYLTHPNLEAFSGQSAALAGGGAHVAVNTLNEHPVLGKVALWHAHRPVYPLATGGPDATDDWAVADWCAQCARKGGVPVWADPFDPAHGGAALVALVNGLLHGVEFTGRPARTALLPAYYKLLAAGVRVPLVGAGGKDSNRTPLGAARTYARLPAGDPVTPAGWVEAVKAGRCFATTGPLLTLTVDGQDSGTTLPAGRRVGVRADAWSLAPFARLDVVADGAVVGSAAGVAADGVTTASVACDFTPPAAGWLAARATGPAAVFAHTAPVYFAGDPGVTRPAARQWVRRCLAESRAWVEEYARFADARNQVALLAEWDAAGAAMG